jgi:APA family basic amino acid/polyamine antiporter
LNGNIFVTPRALYGLAQDGLAPGALARVNPGGTPWIAMLVVAAFSIALAATGAFEQLLGLAIVLVLVVDGWAVIALYRLRRREPNAPFKVPLYPWVPAALVAVYGTVLVGTIVAEPLLAALAAAVLVGAYGLSWTVR